MSDFHVYRVSVDLKLFYHSKNSLILDRGLLHNSCFMCYVIVEQCDNALHAFVDDTLEKLYSIPNGVNTVTTYIISVESCQSLTTVVKMFGKRVENFEKIIAYIKVRIF